MIDNTKYQVLVSEFETFKIGNGYDKNREVGRIYQDHLNNGPREASWFHRLFPEPIRCPKILKSYEDEFQTYDYFERALERILRNQIEECGWIGPTFRDILEGKDISAIRESFRPLYIVKGSLANRVIPNGPLFN